MKVDPTQASEIIIKLLMYLNGVFFLLVAIFDCKKVVMLIIIAVNILSLLLRQGIKKESENIMYRGKKWGNS